MNYRKPAAALAAVALSFGLTACGGGEQSVADACKVAEKEVKDAMGDLNGINPSDTDEATKSISSMGDALDKTEKKLENEKVKTAVGDLSAEFDKLETAFADLKAADKDTAKLTEVSERMSTISTDIQKKGEKLDELCG
ncbi:hypothetical protein GL325_11065 [Aeromicrobium sp. 636]|uniref:Uncharacterized protein n=1 Tax=Aeromicrobium senzhongii TaxID=2663859 RepID=A0A8I0K2T3_9ACTN|nr:MULTISPECIES: hypothetical protein [Aeromicrobium]MBC9226869.1 hypothetical protein [Aeromicrobium senzhongii]MCQ3998969.1 hypothetical protein [Aeromicrobium sp. 636]MTB89525.1 hypothetical protein [Aeromicrobium senzhongii]QNL94344.1 hypothetical protein H9L21_14900 [Aeromicrobium senzhongii]